MNWKKIFKYSLYVLAAGVSVGFINGMSISYISRIDKGLIKLFNIINMIIGYYVICLIFINFTRTQENNPYKELILISIITLTHSLIFEQILMKEPISFFIQRVFFTLLIIIIGAEHGKRLNKRRGVLLNPVNKIKQKTLIVLSIVIAISVSVFTIYFNGSTSGKIDSLVGQMHAYSMLKKYDPDLYKDLINKISFSENSPQSREYMLEIGIKSVSKALPKYIVYASDNAVLGFAEVIVSSTERLYNINPEYAFSNLFRDLSPPKKSFKNMLGDQYDKNSREVDFALGELIRTGYEKENKLINKSKAEKDLEGVMINLYKIYGDDVYLIESPEKGLANKKRTVEVIITLYKEVLKLPEPDSANVLRLMFSES